MPNDRPPHLVLASRSPARAALLRQIGREPHEIAPLGIDETPLPGELPRAYVQRMARDKMAVAGRRHPHAWVLVADTVVACGRRILAATEDAEVARRHLRMLSGRAHRVWSAVRVKSPGGRDAGRLVLTRVRFRILEASEIERYLMEGEWRNKAGSYAVQGRGATFVRGMNGSFENVIGLPVAETEMLLRGLGLPLPDAAA